MNTNDNPHSRKNIVHELKLGYYKIKDNYKYIKSLVTNKEEIIESGEWLLDNIYLIEKEYKNIKHNMPKEYFNNLPIDNKIPRILQLAKEFIKENSNTIKQEILVSFIQNKKEKLTMGELWAFPLMIKIAIILKLSHITDDVVKMQDNKLKDKTFDETTIQQEISLCINSLRDIEAINWRKVFELTSEVEKILSQDPAHQYEKMDFKSKDYYRHKIEELTQKLNVDEFTIARKVISLAKKKHNEEYKKHVGYYLIDEGIKEVAEFYDGKINSTYSTGAFLAINIFGTLLLTTIFLISTYLIGSDFNGIKYVALFLISIVIASEIIVTCINYFVSKKVPIRFIPKLDYSEGIPASDKTIIVIPAIVPSKERAVELIDKLEVMYLGNKDENFYYALLADFKDSKDEKVQGEEEILNAALKRIKVLNKKYMEDKEHFFFFCRKKVFNPKENVYMGWERKRGKLIEFMALLRGEKNHTYNVISGDIDNLKYAKYIITLDADTFMPRDAAKRLVGAMAHVLNKKQGDHGYGIMQPKISISLESKDASIFSKTFAEESGVDGYSTAYSDTYEDLFGKGNFVGKGIIDVDEFYSALKDEIPENIVLSHDLLEGEYLGCALVSDIELIDNYPYSYESSSRRIHRWTRGDWQNIRWLFSSKLSSLSKWKIFDNLRRSLLAPALYLAVIFNLTLFKNDKPTALLCFLAVITPFIFTVTDFVVTPRNKIIGTFKSFKQIVYILSFIPYQAYLMVKAIIVTLFRLFISKRHLLQWQTAEEAERTVNNSAFAYTKRMWFSELSGIIVILVALGASPLFQVVNLLIGILWVMGPYIAWYISLKFPDREYKLSEDDEKYLREKSRRIWAYYEDFVNEENNFLAPDNYQEIPYKGVAYRTSPTNIGMSLISNLAAYDLGYIPLGEVVDRIELTINNMKKLEMFHGHYLNWYDTRNYAPLWPRYISTVDSGNLLGYLWIISHTLEKYIDMPLIRKEEITALRDTASILNINLKYDDINIDIENYEVMLDTVLNNIQESNEYWHQKLIQEIKLKKAYYDFFFEGIQKLLQDKKPISIKELISIVEEFENSSGTDFQKVLNEKVNELKTFLARIKNLIKEINHIIKNMDFTFLYSKDRNLFSIGYNLEENSLGNSFYDLLASESRTASFIAIALNQVPESHWFNLSRAMTNAFHCKSLVSWSGTMFEYFMPALIMKSYDNTLFSKTYESVIKAQIKFAGNKKVPWGISESAYYQFDIDDNYQYKAFGVPGVGLKRGLEDELVISPYSTLMTLPFSQDEGIKNLKILDEQGLNGRYGFIEAIDYTANRVSKMDFGKEDVGNKQVRCYMVHHLGMSLMGLDNILNNDIFIKRFHSIPEVKATELLLKEKVPDRITFEHEENYEIRKHNLVREDFLSRIYNSPETKNPEVLLLSNGSYSCMITVAGSGYGKKDGMTVYRWKGDTTSDSTGSFIYIKNLNSNDYWSTTYEPCKDEGEEYKVNFALDKATYRRRDGSIESSMEVVVSPEDDVEIRKVTLRNLGEKGRSLEITSYMEITLQSFEGDAVHPSFSNLFISTEYLETQKALLGNRRPRRKDEQVPYIIHKIYSEEDLEGAITYETSRLNFIGRDRNLKIPRAMDNDTALLNTVGTVLDPIMSMRARIRLEAGEEKSIYFITATAMSKEESMVLADKYSSKVKLEKVFIYYNKAVQLELKSLGIKVNQANMYQSLASYILFLHSGRKEREKYIKNISKHQQDLWSYGISGDLPIAMAIVQNDRDMDLVRSLIKMHYYWKSKGLKVDLLIYNDEESSYEQPLQRSIVSAINLSREGDVLNKPGGIFLHNKSTMGEDIRDFIIGISALYVDSNKGSIVTQIKDAEKLVEQDNLRHKELENVYRIKQNEFEKNIEENLDALEAVEEGTTYKNGESFNTDKLDFYNGYGGFDPKDKSYVIKLNNFQNTPAPWINVISNENFGFHISESGSSYTWCGNSRENKITPWNNDWVMDPLGEALLIRDDKTGEYFSITPKPVRDKGEYIIRHSFGYSTFYHTAYGIKGEMEVFCPLKENLKINRVTLENICDKERNISIFYYSQLVLGVFNYGSARYITTSIKEDYITGQNPYSKYFGKLKAYLTILGGSDLSFTGDRKEFLGVNGELCNAKALRYENLSNNSGSVYDPCLAVESRITLKPGEKKELIILLGEEEEHEVIKKQIYRYKNVEEVHKMLAEVKQYWAYFLGNIQVKTKDKSMDYLLNGWLLYQTYSCRYLSRTAFYQSGGAYGFRDQLQDSIAIGIVDSEKTKAQIIRSAAKQYLEGDVQHWWHPVINSGIRTRFSDDLLWLPYAVIEYTNRTGDYSVLKERAKYLEDEPLKEGEDERYTIVDSSNKEGTIYEHCIKAIERGLKFGDHNIPLMGSGDWNDGMSTVGNKGKGESVWLGWFLYEILDGFEPLCSYMKDDKTKELFNGMKKFISENIEKNAWDGGWYRRAYFDDGTPLGSRDNEECQIDSIAQSWSIISGAGKENRVREAMQAVDKNLVNKDKGMILLLAPPFEKSSLEPGYIKGYVAGVRENGGQYTHAAVWVILALTKLGLGDKAHRYYHMINPINHTNTALECRTYKLEPYVMAADVYIREPHGGRGGWSWYTGAAGWMYKVGLEDILGLKQIEGKGYKIEPCVPEDWEEYTININNDTEQYKINVIMSYENKIIVENHKIDGEIIPRNLGKKNITVYALRENLKY